MFTSKRISLSACCLSLVVLFAGSGCLHGKKNAKPKESSAIAGDMESEFKRRFVDKRATELTAQGVTPEAARAQANEEFRVRYGATQAAGK